MKSLGNQSKVNPLPQDALEDEDIKMNLQSLADVASYPYPMRTPEQQSGDGPLIASRSPLPEQGSVVVFVYPTRSERLHLEKLRLEKKVNTWEGEGGSH